MMFYFCFYSFAASFSPSHSYPDIFIFVLGFMRCLEDPISGTVSSKSSEFYIPDACFLLKRLLRLPCCLLNRIANPFIHNSHILSLPGHTDQRTFFSMDHIGFGSLFLPSSCINSARTLHSPSTLRPSNKRSSPTARGINSHP